MEILLTDFMKPIYDEYPHLKPIQMEGSYEGDPKIDE